MAQVKERGGGGEERKKKSVFLGFSVWQKNLATSGYALANIHWELDTGLTLAWLCAVSYEKSEVKIYFSKRHIWSRTFEESIRVIFRETSFKRDNFFATYNRNFRGGSALHLKKKVLLPEGLIRTCLLAVHQPAVLHSKLLWCVLFQAEMRKHTSLFLTQNPFLHVLKSTQNRSLKQIKDIFKRHVTFGAKIHEHDTVLNRKVLFLITK